jgi:rhodanese-related sulfurtransferase
MTERALPADVLISPAEARARIDRGDAIILDLIGDESWARLDAAPKNALRIPPSQFRARLPGLSRERELLSLCT